VDGARQRAPPKKAPLTHPLIAALRHRRFSRCGPGRPTPRPRALAIASCSDLKGKVPHADLVLTEVRDERQRANRSSESSTAPAIDGTVVVGARWRPPAEQLANVLVETDGVLGSNEESVEKSQSM